MVVCWEEIGGVLLRLLEEKNRGKMRSKSWVPSWKTNSRKNGLPVVHL